MRVAIVVVATAVVVAALGLGAGCHRPCENSLNCERTCSCVNGNTGAALDCTMAYLCDGKDRICEADFDNQTCDEMCNQYAAHDLCGLERCNVDDDCTKNLSCPILDENGQPTATNFDCTLTFACDPDQHLCPAASTATQDQQCVICRQQAAAGG